MLLANSERSFCILTQSFKTLNDNSVRPQRTVLMTRKIKVSSSCADKNHFAAWSDVDWLNFCLRCGKFNCHWQQQLSWMGLCILAPGVFQNRSEMACAAATTRSCASCDSPRTGKSSCHGCSSTCVHCTACQARTWKNGETVWSSACPACGSTWLEHASSGSHGTKQVGCAILN